MCVQVNRKLAHAVGLGNLACIYVYSAPSGNLSPSIDSSDFIFHHWARPPSRHFNSTSHALESLVYICSLNFLLWSTLCFLLSTTAIRFFLISPLGPYLCSFFLFLFSSSFWDAPNRLLFYVFAMAAHCSGSLCHHRYHLHCRCRLRSTAARSTRPAIYFLLTMLISHSKPTYILVDCRMRPRFGPGMIVVTYKQNITKYFFLLRPHATSYATFMLILRATRSRNANAARFIFGCGENGLRVFCFFSPSFWTNNKCVFFLFCVQSRFKIQININMWASKYVKWCSKFADICLIHQSRKFDELQSKTAFWTICARDSSRISNLSPVACKQHADLF